MDVATAIITGLVIINFATVALAYIQMKQFHELNQFYKKLNQDYENLVYAHEESVKALRKNKRCSLIN